MNELEFKKSRFVAYLYNVNSKEEVDGYLKELKLEHKKAHHICYAYKIGNMVKANDDKEPKGTAGLPILTVITKQNLDNVLIIVVRYFGGIKLGAGPLTRAYLKSASEIVKKII